MRLVFNKFNDIAQRLASFVSRHAVLRFITSFTPMMVCYGTFLFLYEVKFARETVTVVHPVLIGWALLVAAYSLLIRRDRRALPFKYLILAFLASAAVSALVNLETGLVGNLKAFVMTALPLVAFLPYCASLPKKDAQKRLLTVLLGPAILIFVCSAVALGLYLTRFYGVVELGGIKSDIGLRFYLNEAGQSVALLYGIYVDTNHAALYSLATVIYSTVLLAACRNGLFKSRLAKGLGIGFSIANVAVQLSYFPLANSRGGWLSLGVAAAFAFFLVFFFAHRLAIAKRATFVRATVGVVAALVATVVCFGALLSLRTGWATLSQTLNVPPAVDMTPTLPSDTTTAPSDTTTVPPSTTEKPIDSFDKTDFSGSGRLDLWSDAMKLFVHNPVFGHNPGNSAYYAEQHLPDSKLSRGAHYHNSYIDLLLDYGIVGFILLMSFWVACVGVVLKGIFGKKGRLRSLFDYGIVALALLVACGSAFLTCVFINTTAMYFLLICAAGYLTVKRGEDVNVDPVDRSDLASTHND